MLAARLAPSVYAFWPSKFLSRCVPRTWSHTGCKSAGWVGIEIHAVWRSGEGAGQDTLATPRGWWAARRQCARESRVISGECVASVSVPSIERSGVGSRIVIGAGWDGPRSSRSAHARGMRMALAVRVAEVCAHVRAYARFLGGARGGTDLATYHTPAPSPPGRWTTLHRHSHTRRAHAGRPLPHNAQTTKIR